MDIEFEAKCKDCGAILSIGCVSVDDFSILLRCERCGGEKFISDDEIEQAKSKDLEKLSELDSEEENLREIERIAGTCKCGGKPKFDAPPRCPECRSKNIEQVGSTSFYE